ncbi:g7929 [Coccomyxa viridis]|uniref:G7929 protein n=1 Tax=Coccomyxa viridis TaxID=1274662 RepID=A0ABP1G1K5_9CHLO
MHRLCVVVCRSSSSKEPLSPWTMPDNEGLLRALQKEQTERATRIAEQARLAVHLKRTRASEMRARNAHLEGKLNPRRLLTKESDGKGPVTDASQLPLPRRVEKENLAAFISKKREIFMVQMALDIKRQEMQRLAQQAAQHEAALTKAEETLEEDTAAFDKFLKESDEKVQQAMSRADAEMKAKQEKANELKRLQNTLGIAESELRKVREQYAECSKYCAFLDSITPPEFFQEQAARYEAEWQAILGNYLGECQAIKDAAAAARDAKAGAEDRYANARTQQQAEAAEADIKSSTEALAQAEAAVEPEAPVQPSEEDLWYRKMAEPMYFQDPWQLRQIFGDLEEGNLFLIQTSQEAEEAREASAVGHRAEMLWLSQESAALKEQVVSLEQGIAAHKGAITGLQEATGGRVLQRAVPAVHDVPLEELTRKLRAVWASCGVTQDPATMKQMQPLEVLALLESRLEEIIALAAGLPTEVVAARENACEKERRQVARTALKKAQLEEHEARLKRALERSQAPAFKRQGKPVMTRSRLVHKANAQQNSDSRTADHELEEYLQRVDLL